jgi:hypothetical protein
MWINEEIIILGEKLLDRFHGSRSKVWSDRVAVYIRIFDY